MTKKDSRLLVEPTAVVASPSPVVVVSSLASGDENPEEIADKLTEEFGLSMPQTRMVWEYLSNQGKGYVLEKANVVRSEPRENLAGSFVKALEKDWKPKKASGPPKRQKVQPAIQDPLKELSSEEKQAELLVDHYKDSFQLTLEHWKTRNRLFIFTLVTLTLMLFQLTSPNVLEHLANFRIDSGALSDRYAIRCCAFAIQNPTEPVYVCPLLLAFWCFRITDPSEAEPNRRHSVGFPISMLMRGNEPLVVWRAVQLSS